MSEFDIEKLSAETDSRELKNMLQEMDIDTETISEEQMEALNIAIDRVLDGLSDDEVEALLDELGIDDPFDNIISLTDDNGNETDFEFLDEVEYNGDIYLVLTPVEENTEEDATILVLKVENDGTDEESYVPVDDDVAGAVFDIFLQAQEEAEDE